VQRQLKIPDIVIYNIPCKDYYDIIPREPIKKWTKSKIRLGDRLQDLKAKI